MSQHALVFSEKLKTLQTELYGLNATLGSAANTYITRIYWPDTPCLTTRLFNNDCNAQLIRDTMLSFSSVLGSNSRTGAEQPCTSGDSRAVGGLTQSNFGWRQE